MFRVVGPDSPIYKNLGQAAQTLGCLCFSQSDTAVAITAATVNSRGAYKGMRMAQTIEGHAVLATRYVAFTLRWEVLTHL